MGCERRGSAAEPLARPDSRRHIFYRMAGELPIKPHSLGLRGIRISKGAHGAHRRAWKNKRLIPLIYVTVLFRSRVAKHVLHFPRNQTMSARIDKKKLRMIIRAQRCKRLQRRKRHPARENSDFHPSLQVDVAAWRLI